MKKNYYLTASIFAFFTSLSRLVGVFLFIPILFELWRRYQVEKKVEPWLLTLFSAPLIGLGVYCFYLFRTTGDALFFLHSQSAFGANRTSHLMLFPVVVFRYIKIFLTAAWNFQYFIAVAEFCFFIFVLGILLYDLWKTFHHKSHPAFSQRLGLNLFSLTNLLLPTATGTFSSIPRYALMSLSLFVVLGEVKNRWIKIGLITLFTVLHFLLFGLFIQGYFIS